MHELISVTEAAKRSGYSKEWIQKLCQQGRIEGARKLGPVWAIPAGAEISSAEPRGLRRTKIPHSQRKK